jgi:ribosome-associated protein
MIHITDTIAIDEDEVAEEFIRAPGPGGQSVNKVATAVQLRFDVCRSPLLPPGVRQRLISLGGRRVTYGGVLVITARRFRTQEANRRDAMDRLVTLVRRVAERPKPWRRTRPSGASRERRLEAKRRRSLTKRLRQPGYGAEEC